MLNLQLLRKLLGSNILHIAIICDSDPGLEELPIKIIWSESVSKDKRIEDAAEQTCAVADYKW